MIPEAVEPYSTDLAIVGEQFGELVVHELIIRWPVSLRSIAVGAMSGASLRIVLTTPVKMRVVEVERHTLLLTFVGKHLQYILLIRSGIDDVEIRVLSVPH